MRNKLPYLIGIILTFCLIDLSNALSTNTHLSHRLRIVGSSTLYPFITVVAEEFTDNFSFQTPIIEATGTGAGFHLLCTSNAADRPQIVSASRPIKESEVKLCAEHGIKNLKEIKIGHDGIVIAASNESNFGNLSREEIFKALGSKLIDGADFVDNKNVNWKDINPKLPSSKIEIYGPSSTSGTRDVFETLVLEESCLKYSKTLKNQDKEKIAQQCKKIRDGGYYIQVGENDNLIVQKLIANRYALGIFGYNFLEHNLNKVKGLKIDGYEPTYQNIADNKYPISRALYVYYDEDALLNILGAYEFLSELVSNEAISKDGYLISKGLIPAKQDELDKSQKIIKDFKSKLFNH